MTLLIVLFISLFSFYSMYKFGKAVHDMVNPMDKLSQEIYNWKNNHNNQIEDEPRVIQRHINYPDYNKRFREDRIKSDNRTMTEIVKLRRMEIDNENSNYTPESDASSRALTEEPQMDVSRTERTIKL